MRSDRRKPKQRSPRIGPYDAREQVRAMLAKCMELLAVDRTPTDTEPETALVPELEDLSDRELEFLRLARHPDNWPYPYIAVRMKVKLPTLHYTRRKVFDKLGVNSRTALMLMARDWCLG